VKKALISVLSILSLFLLLGCDFGKTTTTTTMTSTTTEDEYSEVDISVPDYFSYQLTTIPYVDDGYDKLFNVEFLSLSFTPIKNQVCFTYNLEDSDYAHATYYMILQKKNVMLPLQQQSFAMSSKDGSNGGCFTAMSEETAYEIIIGKVDRDDLNPSTYIEGVASIEFTDTFYDERLKLGTMSLTHDGVEEYTFDSAPFFNYDFSVMDSGESIDVVTVMLYENIFDTLVESKTFEITISQRSGDYVMLNDILFDDLSPNIDYKIKVYISGNDGFDDYSNIYFAGQTITSSRITNNGGVSFDGLYAEILDVSLDENQAIVTYIAKNDGSIVSSLTNQPYTLILKIFDSQDNEKYSTLVDALEDSITVPIEYVDYGDYAKIISNTGDMMFTSWDVLEPAPEIKLSSISSGMFSIQVLSGIERVNFISLDICTSQNLENYITGVGAEEFISGFAYFDFRSNYDIINRSSVYMFYNISYETTNGTMFAQGWLRVYVF